MCNNLSTIRLQKSRYTLFRECGIVYTSFPTFSISQPIRKYYIGARPQPLPTTQQGIQIPTAKVNTIVSHVRFTVFTFLRKTNSTYAYQWDDRACICATIAGVSQLLSDGRTSYVVWLFRGMLHSTKLNNFS